MENLAKLISRHARGGKVDVPPDASPRLRKLRGIKAVLFDVYGTLFSSSAGDISLVSQENRDELMHAVLSSNGIKPCSGGPSGGLHEQFLETIEEHQLQRQSEGVRFPEVEIRSVWKDYLSKLQSSGRMQPVQDAPIERLAVEFECRVNPVQAMPGVRECLSRLRDSKRKMGIISNAQFYTPLLFSGLLGSDLVELGFSDDISVWSYRLLEGKPSQRLYQVAADCLRDRYSIEPHAVLYIGNDMRNDIWPAQATGFHTALFAGDSLSLRRRLDDPACNKVIPDIEVTHLMQLFDCID